MLANDEQRRRFRQLLDADWATYAPMTNQQILDAVTAKDQDPARVPIDGHQYNAALDDTEFQDAQAFTDAAKSKMSELGTLAASASLDLKDPGVVRDLNWATANAPTTKANFDALGAVKCSTLEKWRLPVPTLHQTDTAKQDVTVFRQSGKR